VTLLRRCHTALFTKTSPQGHESQEPCHGVDGRGAEVRCTKVAVTFTVNRGPKVIGTRAQGTPRQGHLSTGTLPQGPRHKDRTMGTLTRESHGGVFTVTGESCDKDLATVTLPRRLGRGDVSLECPFRRTSPGRCQRALLDEVLRREFGAEEFGAEMCSRDSFTEASPFGFLAEGPRQGDGDLVTRRCHHDCPKIQVTGVLVTFVTLSPHGPNLRTLVKPKSKGPEVKGNLVTGSQGTLP